MNKYNNKQHTLSFFGVGSKIKNSFISNFGINKRINPLFLKSKKFNTLNLIIKQQKLGNKLIENIKKRISFFISIKNFKGSRHKLNYPCRGQRTHTNAKTTKRSKKNR